MQNPGAQLGGDDGAVIAPARPWRDTRIWLCLLLLTAICVAFWSSSRYPSLDTKAGADPGTVLQTPLGFDRHFSRPDWQEFFAGRVALTALEWLETNRLGMSFGLLAAAAILSLIPLLPAGRGGSLAATLRGALLGAPLGVCANCAAPVGLGMLGAGSRRETALALIISSPSFNIVILGMLFALFPIYLVAIKIISALLLILIAVPLATRFSGATEARMPEQLAGRTWLPALDQDQAGADKAHWSLRELPASLGWVLRAYCVNLLRILILAVPLMLLAGILGAVLVEWLPWSRIDELAAIRGHLQKALILLAVAGFGALLPVPIAFDIILCAMLMAAGVPVFIVAALLVTLGAFSIYPWLLLGRFWSWRGASLLLISVATAGVLGGAAANYLGRWQQLQQNTAWFEKVLRAPVLPEPEGGQAAKVYGPDEISALIRRLPPCEAVASDLAGVSLHHCPDQPLTKPAGAFVFSESDGSALGLRPHTRPQTDAVLTLHPSHYSGLASGDVNADGWPDLALGTAEGPRLFINIGGRFVRQDLGRAAHLQRMTGPVALLDLDNDRDLELIYGTLDHGLHVLWNDAGSFARHTAYLTDHHGFVTALAFADFNRDGFLDIAAGLANGVQEPVPDNANANWVLMSTAQGWVPQLLPGPGGETLSLLAHDFDRDGWPDLMAGNDFMWPDIHYRNEGGQLQARVKPDPMLRSPTTHTTMSLDVARLENDDFDSVYAGQIAFGPVAKNPVRYADHTESRSCEIFEQALGRTTCQRYVAAHVGLNRAMRAKSFSACDEAQAQDQALCQLVVAENLLGSRQQTCAQLVAERSTPTHYLRFCQQVLKTPGERGEGWGDYRAYAEVQAHSNALHRTDGRRFEAVAGQAGAGIGAWTWNARFHDLNADGFQDLTLANGWWPNTQQLSPTLFYRGDGQSFHLQQNLGFSFDFSLTAQVALDYDRDGDTDLIAVPPHLPPLVYNNEQNQARMLIIAIDSACGNTHGIGSTVIAEAAGHRMTRFIKASGGYASAEEPLAAFGLGEHPQIDRVEIHSPDFDHIQLRVPLRPGRYRLSIAADSGLCAPRPD